MRTDRPFGEPQQAIYSGDIEKARRKLRHDAVGICCRQQHSFRKWGLGQQAETCQSKSGRIRGGIWTERVGKPLSDRTPEGLLCHALLARGIEQGADVESLR